MTSAAIAQPLPEPAPSQSGGAPADLPLAQPPLPWLAQVMLDTVSRSGARVGLVWIFFVAFFAVFSPFLASSHPYILKTTDPQLIAQYGRVSSPLLRHLSGADVTLLALGLTCIWLYFKRGMSTSAKLLLAVLVVAVMVPASHWKAWTDSAADAFAHRGRSKDLTRTRLFFAAAGSSLLLLADLAIIVVALRSSVIPTKPKRIAAILLTIIVVLLAIIPVNPPLLADYTKYRKAEAAGHVQYILRAPLPYSPTDRLSDQFDLSHPPPQPPSRAHLLGTETYGADILSRMMHACRIAMAIGFIATGIAVAVGVVVGGLMGYFVGWVDLIGMRLVEIFGSIPVLYLLLACVAFFGRDLYLMMVIIGLTSWVGDARFVRAEFLRLRNQDFVQAARAAGLPLRSILFRHMLPNAMAPLLVSASFGIASAILLEATLSFLGLGLVDEPSWGQLLNQAVSESGVFSWWLATFPGVAIFLTVFSYNLIGEAVRDALDPKLKGID
jgi:peptide/nickel transport system permease protein